MEPYTPDVIEKAVARAREVGTRHAARELGLDPRRLKEWRREANRAGRADVHEELDALELRIEQATDLAELDHIKRAIAKIAREVDGGPDLVYLFDEAA